MQLPKSILSYERDDINEMSRLSLVSISVESSLLGHDIQAYEKVSELLDEKYHCAMYECYYHPKYLREALETLPKSSCHDIVESIQKGLGEFTYIDGISQFLDELKE